MDPHWPGCGILFSLSNRFSGWVRLVKRSWEKWKTWKNMEKYDLMDWETWTISSWCYTYCFANSWANNGQLWPMAGLENCKDPLILAESLHFRPWTDTEKHYQSSIEHRWVFVSRVSSSRVAPHRHYFHPVGNTEKYAMMMMMPTEDLICTGCGFLAKIKWMMDGGGKVVSKEIQRRPLKWDTTF